MWPQSKSVEAPRLAQLVEDVGGTVLRERLLEVFDGSLEVALLGKGAANPSQGLRNELVVGAKLHGITVSSSAAV